MKTRIHGYLIRIWVRLKSDWNTLMWLNAISTEPHELSDWGLMIHAQSLFSDTWFAIRHFPSLECAQSWIRSVRDNA